MNLEREKQLISEIGRNPANFGIIFDTYYPAIFGYIFRRVADYDLTRDIASETFLKGFMHISSFKWRGVSISHWLYRIANSEIQQYFRKEKYKPRSIDLLIESSGWEPIDPDTANEEKMRLEKEVEKHQYYAIIREKTKLLPAKYQEALSLRYFEQKSIQEVASILDKPEGTVKSLISRGIKKLQKIL